MHDELYNQYMSVVEENNILRRNVAEMQEEIHNLQVRVKELRERDVVKEEEFDETLPMFAEGGIASLMK